MNIYETEIYSSASRLIEGVRISNFSKFRVLGRTMNPNLRLRSPDFHESEFTLALHVTLRQ